MSSKVIDDGGPAFPRPASEFTKNGTLPDGNDAIHASDGMTLRDWFAGQALAGALADPNVEGTDLNALAGYAYEVADTMLVQRGKDTRSEVRSLSLDAGLGLRGRASNVLYCEGVDTVGQLCEMYETDLLKMRGFGEGSLDAVKAALAAHGLTLKGVARPTPSGEGTP